MNNKIKQTQSLAISFWKLDLSHQLHPNLPVDLRVVPLFHCSVIESCMEGKEVKLSVVCLRYL